MRARLAAVEESMQAEHFMTHQFIYFNVPTHSFIIKDQYGKVLRTYTPENACTVRHFHAERDKYFHRVVMGPRGSSKSSGMCADMILSTYESSPCKDGVKRSRWLIGRETYGELETTTIKTFEYWFGFEELNWHCPRKPPIQASLKYFDGECPTEIEILFISFDKEKDAKKALSLELTGAYFNEASEISTAAMDEATGSVGRYPAIGEKIEGGHYYHGLIYDTNAFPTYHPLYEKYILNKPLNHHIYIQPGGLIEDQSGFHTNLKAENIKNLPPHYYETMAQGKSKDFVRTRICNQFGQFETGKPCHPEYLENVHGVDNVVIDPNYPLLLSHDYGGVNASLIGQFINNQLIAIKEFISVRASLREHLLGVRQWIRENSNGLPIKFSVGDPADNYSHETARNSSEIATEALAIPTGRAVTNNIAKRLDSINQFLMRRIGADERGLKVNKEGCPVLHAGLCGKYKLLLQKSGDKNLPIEKPEKNSYSHTCDCAQYMALEVLNDPENLEEDIIDLNNLIRPTAL